MGNSDSTPAAPAPSTPAANAPGQEIDWSKNPNAVLGKDGKPKICCSCPDTKKIRDECVVLNGEENCTKEIEAHKACLRTLGFDV